MARPPGQSSGLPLYCESFEAHTAQVALEYERQMISSVGFAIDGDLHFVFFQMSFGNFTLASLASVKWGLGIGLILCASCAALIPRIVLSTGRIFYFRQCLQGWRDGRGGEIRTPDLLYPKQAR